MSDPQANHTRSNLDAEESAALFASLISQQASMALMLMGKVAHPDTGQSVKDLEAARLFIDHLEVLESRTKGNLSKEEEAYLKQTLMSLRLAYVQAVESPEGAPQKAEAKVEPAAQAAAAAVPQSDEPLSAQMPTEEHQKKFSKKY